MENFDDKYKKRNPFTVPEGYFEGLTGRIMDQLEEQRKPRKVKFLQRIKPYLGLVAIFLLALLVIQAIYPLTLDKERSLQKERESQVALSSEGEEDIFDSGFNPTSEEIIEYLASEVDSYELIYAENY